MNSISNKRFAERIFVTVGTMDREAVAGMDGHLADLEFSDRHGFWGGAVFAGFHKAPRFRCRSRNSLWPSKLSAPIFRQPTSVQQSLLPFPRP